jgi:hypothetical protein
MQFFRIKKVKDRNFKSLIFRERKRKYEKESDTYISKIKPIIIYGKAAAGKSKEISKLWEQKQEIWDQKKYNFIWFSGTDSITEILHKNLTDEDNAKFSEEKLEEYLNFDIDLDEHINKQYIKLRILSEKAKSSILFMDDTDKLTGKKLEIAKELLRNSKNFIITATDEHTINKTIRHLVIRKRPTLIDLNTSTSYDATNIVFVVFIISLFTTGMYEMAMLVMAGRFAMKGMGTK